MSRVLLTYHDTDDATTFANHLLESTAYSRQLTGFLKTLDLLDDLVEGKAPLIAKRGACMELSKWYALETPEECNSIVAEAVNSEEYLARLERLRQSLIAGGLPWIRLRTGATNEGDVLLYLRLLRKSRDENTRIVAKRLGDA